MFEWNLSVQRMLDCVEENLSEPITLEALAARLHYSPGYCTRQFRRYAGISLRDYIRLRKTSCAVLDLRDTQDRILDIAVKYGFSSQEAFTRAFVKAYGITPGAYRRMPKPLPLLIRRNTYNPYFLGLEEITMENEKEIKGLEPIRTSIQVLPAHKFIGIRNIGSDNYFGFWQLQESMPGLTCYEVSGVLESIKSYNGQIGGWFYQDGRRGYLYGIEVPANYAGEVPAGMECTLIPETPYAVFHHPPYDYDLLDHAVYDALQSALEQWNPTEYGYDWDDSLPTYQRHNPQAYGQGFCRPLKKR